MTAEDLIPVTPSEPDKSIEVCLPETPSKEFGGPKGPEPTRFGDWEIKGRCSDF